MSEAARHNYDDRFFDYVERGARRSAQRIIPFLRGHLQVSSVVDIGCGRGVWVDEWRRSGVEDALGIDGEYVSADRLVIPKECFAAFDLSEPIRLGPVRSRAKPRGRRAHPRFESRDFHR